MPADDSDNLLAIEQLLRTAARRLRLGDPLRERIMELAEEARDRSLEATDAR